MGVFLKRFNFFRSVLDSQKKKKGGGGSYVYVAPYCHAYVASPIINISHQSCAFAATDEVTLTYMITLETYCLTLMFTLDVVHLWVWTNG